MNLPVRGHETGKLKASARTMHAYTAYGLGIHSFLPLPELVPGARERDVVIRPGTLGHASNEVDGSGVGLSGTAAETSHVVEGVGALLVRHGREIVVDAARQVDDAMLRLFILGPALGVLLHQRGYLVLHASTVVMDGGAVAFLGGRGWGKSTIAAALHARGHPVLADDVTAARVGSGRPVVLPAVPQLRLWPDSLRSLGKDSEALPRLQPLSEKRACLVRQGFPREPAPLRCVYVLAADPAPSLEPLAPREACIELLRHWYGARFGDRLLRIDGGAPSHLRRCADLAATVPIRRLTRPRSFPSLERLACLVEDDQAHLA